MNKKEQIVSQASLNKNITKSFKMSSIKIPKSKKNNLIIPALPTGFGFYKLDINKTFVESIPTARINESIHKFNLIVDAARIKKKLEDNKNVIDFNMKAVEWLLIFGAVICFLMYLFNLYDMKDFKETYIWVPLGLIFAVVILSVIFMSLAVTKDIVTINVNEIILKNLTEEFKKESDSYYQQKGYQLRLGTQFCWLEVKKFTK